MADRPISRYPVPEISALPDDIKDMIATQPATEHTPTRH